MITKSINNESIHSGFPGEGHGGMHHKPMTHGLSDHLADKGTTSAKGGSATMKSNIGKAMVNK